MNGTLIALVLAATLEIGGDAAIRAGLNRSAWVWLALGAVILVAYGFTVNLNRGINFGRLMGVYIAVFFAVSQAISFIVFGETPSLRLMLGGALIVGGGVVIHLGPPP
jgi:drug/metabolite transporter superfamily protein YnfA